MESNSIPLFSYAMRFGSVLFGLVRLEYLSFGVSEFYPLQSTTALPI